MSESNDQVVGELQQFLDPDLEQQASASPIPTEPAPPFAPQAPVPVELDDALVDLARQAAHPSWYASWVTGAVMIGAPILTLMAGIAGGSESLIAAGEIGLYFIASCGFLLVAGWIALFVSQITYTAPLRKAIRHRRAWSLTGYVNQVTPGGIFMDNVLFQSRSPVPQTFAGELCTLVWS